MKALKMISGPEKGGTKMHERGINCMHNILDFYPM
jgi:hypothetical protein